MASIKTGSTSNPQLEIYCDGKLAVKGPAQLMPQEAAGAEETVAQFVTVRISFKSFLRLSSARNVRINLGSNHFELMTGDIAALTGMAAHAGASAATSNNGD